MILHVARLDKFIPPYIKFIQENFEFMDHYFWLSGDAIKYPVMDAENLHVNSKSGANKFIGYLNLIKQIHFADKVILHGLFDSRIILILALFPWCLRKCNWVIWGADLYSYQKARDSFKVKIAERVKSFVIRRLGFLTTYIDGDVDLARRWYGARGEHLSCLMYQSNVIGKDVVNVISESDKRDSNTINVLVGNSADPTNNHFEIFDNLAAYKAHNIKIYAPLSYGDTEYANTVKELGRSVFGEKFIPITDFMQIQDYLQLLSKMDIAVFNHRRQQGMGILISLLGMGKTVYMDADISSYMYLTKMNIKVKDVSLVSLECLTGQESTENKDLVASVFNEEELIRQWHLIFEG